MMPSGTRGPLTRTEKKRTGTMAGVPHLPPRPEEEALVLDFIRVDARAGRFEEWGASTVIDEHTRTPVIDPGVFVALHEAAGIEARFPVGNAGVLHVYGYWFSTAPTPFGFKRDRWADGGLATAFGLARDAFLLHGDDGTTPLQRVAAAALGPLRDARRHEIISHDGNPIAAAPSGDAVVSRATMQVDGLDTRAVLFRAPDSEVTALVYGLARPGDDYLLITTFPVSGDTDAFLAEFEREQRLHWNAVGSHP